MRCCANCDYWEPYGEHDEVTELDDGDCRRYPPSVPCLRRVSELGIAEPETARNTVLMAYPVMFATEWCGEFRETASPRIREDA